MISDSEHRRRIELAKKPHCEKTDEEYEEYARIKFRVGFGQIVGPRYAAGDPYSRMFATWWVKENELPLSSEKIKKRHKERTKKISKMTEDEFIEWLKKENEEFYRDGSELERLRKKNIKYYKK